MKDEQWREKSNTLLAEMLYVMSLSLGYEFDKVHLRKEAYTPQAHATIEMEQAFIRQFPVELSMPIRLAQIPKFYRIRGIADLTTGRAFRYPKGYLIASDGWRRLSHHGKDA